MQTFQDYINSKDKDKFIINLIDEFKESSMYLNAVDAQLYYKGENSTIMARKPVIWTNYGQKEDIFAANNQVASEFFPKIVKQEVNYLLSNGLTTDEDIKKGLGQKFDILLQKAGIFSLVDSVSWGYCYLGAKGFAIDIWRGTECIPLFDERTAILKAMIRFWQTDINKPIFIELYEEDGKTEYQINYDDKSRKSELVETASKKPYMITKQKDFLGERVIQENNWSVLPIFPLYANDIKESEFSYGLKSKIDLFDIINSDFGNTLEDSRDVFWVLRNYNGQDINDFIRDYKEYKAIKVDDDGDATPHTIEVPWEARKTALEMLRNQIYSDAMALDTSVLSGGSLTTVAIRAMYSDLDLKTDGFENCCYEFVENIINLYLEYKNETKEYKIEFIRNMLVNESEKIDNIYKMREDISHITALRLNPYIEDAQEELDLYDEEGIDKYNIDNQQNINNQIGNV